MPSNTHTCTAHGCTRSRREDQLMCSRHWNMVPAQLRAKIYRAWRLGKTTEHRAHVREARDIVRTMATSFSREGALPL